MNDEDLLADVYNSVHDFFIEDPTVLSVLKKYEKRSEEGMKVYGESLRDSQESLEFFLVNLQEELMDSTLYIEKILEKIKELNTCQKVQSKDGAVLTILKTMKDLVSLQQK